MEDGEITVDELSIKVKRATELIKICKNKLTSTEEDVNMILKELEAKEWSIRQYVKWKWGWMKTYNPIIYVFFSYFTNFLETAFSFFTNTKIS